MNLSKLLYDIIKGYNVKDNISIHLIICFIIFIIFYCLFYRTGEKISYFLDLIPISTFFLSLGTFAFNKNMLIKNKYNNILKILLCCFYITNISFLTELMIGVLFIVLGNYIPTVKPNYTVGIRTSWALDDPDNWYHTHRFGGKCMVIGGILLIVLSPFMNLFIFFIFVFIPVLLPIIYSYLYFRKKSV